MKKSKKLTVEVANPKSDKYFEEKIKGIKKIYGATQKKS